VVFDKKSPLRLRPSVSVIPTSDKQVWEFFQSNTRRMKHIKLAEPELAEILYSLNGETIDSLMKEHKHLEKAIESLLPVLIQWSMIEYVTVANEIENNDNYRVLNFLADYIPSDQLLNVFNNLENSTVLIIGVGGVGSWIALGLAQSGVKNFILCDPDTVKPHNLNRSLFYDSDIGELKTKVICNKVDSFGDGYNIIEINEMINSSGDVVKILDVYDDINLVINASDFPNVDTTSELIFEPCMVRNIPHIVAGGYNLHLSLIGPTIIPHKTACFKCIGKGLELQQQEDFSSIRKLQRKKRNIGNISPLAGISASFTINESIRVLCQSDKLAPVMTNKRGEFNFLTSEVAFSNYEKLDDCFWCGAKNA
jgi:molybdopterin/thiamine biosynthesis adenylyltransferase